MVQRPPHFIKVQHGKMELNIPISLFEDGTSKVRPDRAEELRSKLKVQFPWLTDNAVDVILKTSSEEMARIVDGRKPAAQKAREMMRSGRAQAALDWLEVHLDLEPGDADAWYAKAEVLFKLERKKEAFEAMKMGKETAVRAGRTVSGLIRE